MQTIANPEWYEGTTPWAELTPAVRLWEAVEGYDASAGMSYEQLVNDAGWALGDEWHYDAVAAVMRFAGRTAEDEAMADAVAWLVEQGYISETTDLLPTE